MRFFPLLLMLACVPRAVDIYCGKAGAASVYVRESLQGLLSCPKAVAYVTGSSLATLEGWEVRFYRGFCGVTVVDDRETRALTSCTFPKQRLVKVSVDDLWRGDVLEHEGLHARGACVDSKAGHVWY